MHPIQPLLVRCLRSLIERVPSAPSMYFLTAWKAPDGSFAAELLYRCPEGPDPEKAPVEACKGRHGLVFQVLGPTLNSTAVRFRRRLHEVMVAEPAEGTVWLDTSGPKPIRRVWRVERGGWAVEPE